MTIDELIAIVEYKKNNIKAHISPATLAEIEVALIHYKWFRENQDIDTFKNHENLKVSEE